MKKKSLLIALFTVSFILITFLSFKYSKIEIDDNTITKEILFDKLPEPTDTIPTLTVKDKKNKSVPLRMNELKIDVKVIGNIARTSMDMTFINETDRILEGELNFPMGEGISVTGFAMDVNGKLREAVPIEKEKGQQVFEAIVRKNIDPGLLEKTKGNNFKARVYPIPAKGHKRIVITYEQELIGLKSGNLYLLPLEFKDKLDIFNAKVEVFKQEVKPELEQNELTNFEFKKWNESFIAEKKQTNYIADKQIGFSLPLTNNIYQTYFEKAIKSTDDNFFYITLQPEKYSEKKKLPKKICLILDVSASANKKDIEKEVDVLEKYFKKIGNSEIRLITFSNEVHTDKKKFSLKNSGWDLVKRRILNSEYDGATQIGSLDLNKYSCDEFILISDGISNFGENNLKIGKAPVMVINSCQSADFSYLKYIAAQTGGQFINLNNKTTNEAVKLLSEQVYQFISATYNNDDVSEIYPSIPNSFGKNFSLSGQIKAKNTEITLNFGFGTKIHKSVKVKLEVENINENSDMIQRLWAQKKIAELDMLFERNKEQISKLGKKYTIVTRNTSLIILDRIEDYVQYEIVPPRELQNEYFEIVENQKREQINLETAHLDKVIADFKNRIVWWETKFSTEKPKNVNNNKKDMTENGDEREVSDDAALEGIVTNEMSVEEDPGNASGNGINEKKKDKGGKTKASIKLNAWNPQTPYIAELKKVSDANLYSKYLNLKKEYESTPSFFLDVANHFIKKGKDKQALRILSNIAELDLQNHELLRILAHRLEQLKHYKLAIFIYEEVLKMRSEEVQSYRDLALCLADDNQHQKAVDIIYNAIKKPWDGRFPGIETIMAYEMNRIISDADGKVNTDNINKELIKEMPVDVRVVLNWDTDNSDMDLWVTGPYGEKCYYSHNRTHTGGMMSNDFTQGYGPEEFLIKNAIEGKYTVQTNYYGSSQQRIAGPTTIYLELYTNYGKKNEHKEVITMRLSSSKEVIDIGVLEFKK